MPVSVMSFVCTRGPRDAPSSLPACISQCCPCTTDLPAFLEDAHVTQTCVAARTRSHTVLACALSSAQRPPPCSCIHDDPATHPSASVQLGKDKPVPYLRTWYFSDDIPELVEDFTPPPLFHSTDAFGRLPEDLQPPFRWQTFCKVVIYCLFSKNVLGH